MKQMITISSYSGGGKTTVADAFGHRYGLPVIHFDDIDRLMTEPIDFQTWLKSGANYEAYGLESMSDHVSCLRHERPGSPLIFDYPFGRLHSAFRSEIGLAVFIDTPLDIAMARRLIRDMPILPSRKADWLECELSDYLRYGRKGYEEMSRQILPSCDVVLDGRESVDSLVDSVHKAAIDRKIM